MPHRSFAAVILLSALIALPVEARPRDPVSQFFTGLSKAFSGTPERTKRTKRTTVAKAKPRHSKVPKDTLSAIPSITVHPLPKEPAPLANASGIEVLPDKTQLRNLTASYARIHGIDPKVGVALVQVESRFDPWAVGSAGEIGLVQIKCQTARELGYTGTCRNLHHVGTNLRYGMTYLARAKEMSDGSLCGMLAKYNAGLYSNARRQRYCDRVTEAMN